MAARPDLTFGDIGVTWIGGGLWVRWPDGGLLLDAPPATAALGSELGWLRAIVSSSGRIRSVGGLLGALAEADRWQRGPVEVHHAIQDERASLVAETWQRGWPDGLPIEIDAHTPGQPFPVGPFTVHTRSVEAFTPNFHSGTLQPSHALGVRLTGPLTLAWVPGAAPSPVVAHLCRGADLAVVEVGVLPWPRGPARLRPEDAIRAAAAANLVWLVGDDGIRLDHAD